MLQSIARTAVRDVDPQVRPGEHPACPWEEGAVGRPGRHGAIEQDSPPGPRIAAQGAGASRGASCLVVPRELRVSRPCLRGHVSARVSLGEPRVKGCDRRRLPKPRTCRVSTRPCSPLPCAVLTWHFAPRQNDLTYMRIDTKRFEILVAPFWGEVKYQVLVTLHVSA